jgi:excisionase family DNA binding protein
MTDTITIETLAAELGVSDRSVRRYIARRKLAVIRLGHRTVRIRRSEAERFKEKLTQRSIL